jgi:hypothetical protein
MEMMDKMMESMMSGMSKEEKEQMMGKMMEKFFAGMTVEDKQKMMEQMMPKMMEGVNMMDMMPRMMMGMMSGGEKMEMSKMPQMMPEMMPYCLGMVLPSMPKEERVDFALKMVASLVEQGCAGMSNEEKAAFVAKIIEKVKNWSAH